MITQISTIFIYVENQQVSLKFWTEKVGLNFFITKIRFWVYSSMHIKRNPRSDLERGNAALFYVFLSLYNNNKFFCSKSFHVREEKGAETFLKEC